MNPKRKPPTPSLALPEANCSADVQSALSPNSSRLAAESYPAAGPGARLADWKSAIRQNGNLRYGLATLLVLLAAAEAGFSGEEQLMKMSVEAWPTPFDYDEDSSPVLELQVVYTIHNNSPRGDVFNLMNFSLPAGSKQGVYDVLFGDGMDGWVCSIGENTTCLIGNGNVVVPGRWGEFSFYSHFPLTRQALATAEAFGEGDRWPFPPVEVPVPAGPVVVGVAGQRRERVDLTNRLFAPVELACVLTNAALFTTTDGSAPTTNSAPYTGPFPLASNAVVRALAVDRTTGQSWEAVPVTVVFHETARLRAARLSSSVCRLTLTGQTNLHWLLQSSTTLTNWTALTTLTNATGTVTWDDMNADSGVKFYRTQQAP